MNRLTVFALLFTSCVATACQPKPDEGAKTGGKGMPLPEYSKAPVTRGADPATRPAAAASVGELVALLDERAAANDQAFFKRYLEQTEGVGADTLVGMIKRVELAKTYTERREDQTDTAFRLNYHWPERQAHFQVIAERDGQAWTVKRIYFCR